MLKLTLLVLSLAACGGADPTTPADTGSTDTAPADVAAGAYRAHFTETQTPPPPAKGCGALADIQVSVASCAGVATTIQGPGGECSVGCFADSAGTHAGIGCHGCSSAYDITFTAQ